MELGSVFVPIRWSLILWRPVCEARTLSVLLNCACGMNNFDATAESRRDVTHTAW